MVLLDERKALVNTYKIGNIHGTSILNSPHVLSLIVTCNMEKETEVWVQSSKTHSMTGVANNANTLKPRD